MLNHKRLPRISLADYRSISVLVGVRRYGPYLEGLTALVVSRKGRHSAHTIRYGTEPTRTE